MQAAGKQSTERWFKFAIGLGLFTAVTLLVNSVVNYSFVSRRVLVEHLRQDLAAQTALLDQQLRASAGEAGSLVDAIYKRNEDRLAWVQLRDSEDRVVAHAGTAASAVFPANKLREQLHKRQPAFRTLETAGGEVLVEAFPLRFRPAGVVQPTLFRTAALEAPKPGSGARAGFGVVEMAVYVNAVDTVFWPIRRNLIINVTAALVLIAALGVMAWRFRAYLKGQTLEQQVADASLVQRDLVGVPQALSADFTLAAEYSPASAVGGDFYDAFALDQGRTAFVLGDVAGKGVPAALLTGVIHGAVRSSAWSGSAREHASATAMINRLLCEKAARSRYASMFWSYFDPASGELAYVNAGHFAPLLYRAGAGEPERLEVGGPVLGLLPDAAYRQGYVQLQPGDTLVMYSDGIVEAANPLGELFGEERLERAVQAGKSPEAIRAEILDQVQRFARSEEDGDDRTLVVIRYAPKEAPALLAA